MREIRAELDAVGTTRDGRERGVQRLDRCLDENGHRSEFTRVPVRRPFAAAFLAAAFFAASCSDSTGPTLSVLDATVLTGRLTSIDRAVATPPLQSLGSLALAILNAGINVQHLTPATLGRTLEWQPVLQTLEFTDRTGAPAGAMRVMLYKNDGGRPIYPLVEIGTADLYPYNSYNGGGPDSISLRFVVTGGEAVVADFTAHSHVQANCQCATVEGWVSDGTTRLDFTVPYNIPLNGDGYFPGVFDVTGMHFEHLGTLPGPNNTTATALLSLEFTGDSITASSLLRPHGGRLIGESTIQVGGQPFAFIHETADSLVITGTGGRTLTGAEQGAVRALLALPADIDFYIEWPTFVIFFCGC